MQFSRTRLPFFLCAVVVNELPLSFGDRTSMQRVSYMMADFFKNGLDRVEKSVEKSLRFIYNNDGQFAIFQYDFAHRYGLLWRKLLQQR